MTTIVLATQNPGKTRELRTLLVDTPFEIVGLDSFDREFEEPIENGDHFEANARIKAIAYAQATGELCLADDSGLEIDALNGRPGVISSHYAFDGVETPESQAMSRDQRDALNSQRVMQELSKVDDKDRGARFVCTMVLANPQGEVLATTRGEFEGRVGQEHQVPRGEHGFGYDPYFLVAPDYEHTSAELSPENKNAISHRAKAVGKMIEYLTSQPINC